MSLLRFFYRHRLRLGLLAGLLVVLAGGFAAVIQAQPADPTECRVFDNVRVCGDRVLDIGEVAAITGAIVTLGQVDGPPLIRIRPHTDISVPDDLRGAGFFYFRKEPVATRAHIDGDIELYNDPLNQPLIRTNFIGGSLGFLYVNTEEGTIYNPPQPPRNIAIRNQNLSLDFLKASAMRRMYFGASLEELSDIDVTFVLRTRQFIARVPVSDQKLLFGREVFSRNPELIVNVQFDEFAKGKLTVSAFSADIFGLRGEFKNVNVLSVDLGGQAALHPQQAEEKPLDLEIGEISFSRADNPDLPNLDPSKPDLVFSLQGVQLKDGQFSIRGGAVGLPDWQVGRAFKLSGQQVSIVTDPSRTSSTLIISSTLSFPTGSAVTDSRTFPMAIRVSGKELPGGKITPAITGTLQTSARPALDFGPLTISTPAKTELIFSPEQNFFGLVADQVALKWDANLGGGSGVQSGLKLGVDKNRQLVFGLGAGGGITLPSLKSKAVTLQLSGTLENTADLTTFKIAGSAQIALPGNGGVAPKVTMFIRSGKDVNNTCPPKLRCVKRFEWQLTSFNLKLAGFGLGIDTAQGTLDGGFSVASAALTVPIGIKSVGGSVKSLTISGDGDVSLLGGSVELPPMQVGSFSLVGVKGSFARTATGYEFKGAGTVPLPGLEPNSGKKISGEVIVRARPDGSFTGFGVSIQFDTGSPGIPIANTGMELTMLKGGFDVNSGTVKISVGMRASSQIRFATLPAATAEGNATLQFSPFQLTANAKLSVLVLQVAQASLGIGHQQGIAGGPGFNVSFDLNFVLTHGHTEVRIGPVTLSNGERKTVITAEALYTVGIKRSAIFPLMPPRDINIASLAFKGGTFTVKGKSETLGLLGRVKISIPLLPDPSLSIFVNLQDKSVDVTDTDDYRLIGAQTLRAQAAQGVAGYSSRSLSPDEAQALSLSAAPAAPGAGLLQESLPVTLDRPGMAIFGISYPPGGAPALRLRLPDGNVLTEKDVAEGKVSFLRYTEGVSEPHELAFVLAEAMPGSYDLIIDGAPATYDTVSYMLNEEPVVTEVAVSCGGPAIEGVSVSCGGVAAGGEASVSWSMRDPDSPGATVQVGYAPLAADGSPDLLQLAPLAEGLPQGPGSFTWRLGDVPSGGYALVVSANDGQNAPVEVVTTPAILVDDRRAPAAPRGLVAEPLPGELLIRWSPSPERDVAGYMIGFGVVRAGVADDPANFVYTRDMGAKETSLEQSALYDAKLWGLADDQEVFVGLRAYDRSGNQSDWTLLRARPWALSPAAWTPIPDGALPAMAAVEVAFETPLALPLDGAPPAGLLTLQGPDGAAVPGRLEALLGLDGEAVLGLRFVPEAELRDGERYTALLKGGAGGLSAADGRRMAQDYSWSFVAEARRVYLPLVAR